jgi:hypothetical protein
MRLKLILTLVLLVAGAIIGTGWLEGRATAARLQDEHAELRRRHSELLRLQADHERLRRTLLEAMQRASLREAEVARASPPAPVEEPPIVASAGLVPGEWAASRTWANRGQVTAPAAVETALWAAAGGDVSSLVGLLELDEGTRKKAADLLAKLPIEARSTFGSPEQLIAIATMKNIPVTEAQVTWFNEVDADHAVVGLLLGDAEDDPAAESSRSPIAGGVEAPPALAEGQASKLAYLTLRRGDSGGWRLVVPASAVDRIAREFGVGKE